MTNDETKLIQIVHEIYHEREHQSRMNIDELANDVLEKIDPEGISHPLITVGCVLGLRDIAQQVCTAPHSQFPELQRRYPAAHEGAEYIRLEDLSAEDVRRNVSQLREESEAS